MPNEDTSGGIGYWVLGIGLFVYWIIGLFLIGGVIYLVLGVFRNRNYAEQAILDLESSGFSPKEMSIIMRDFSNPHLAGSSTETNVTEGAVSGMATGGVVGGIAGLLIGIGAIAVPGLGGVLIGGPLAASFGLSGAAATTVSGAVTGALAGGLLGALVGLGLPESDAKMYEQHIRDGGILLAVPDTGRREEIILILQDNGSENIRTVSDFESESYRHIAQETRYSQPLYDDPYVQSGYAGAKGGEVEEVEPKFEEESNSAAEYAEGEPSRRTFWQKVKGFFSGN